MFTIKYLLVIVGLWIARLGGWQEPVCQRLHAPDAPYMESARRIAAEVARQAFRNGQQKRDAALRALLNLHPTARERDLMLALELAVQDA